MLHWCSNQCRKVSAEKREDNKRKRMCRALESFVFVQCILQNVPRLLHERHLGKVGESSQPLEEDGHREVAAQPREPLRRRFPPFSHFRAKICGGRRDAPKSSHIYFKHFSGGPSHDTMTKRYTHTPDSTTIHTHALPPCSAPSHKRFPSTEGM